jgi:RNA polymerase sigma-70 factor (ECF subfamily)
MGESVPSELLVAAAKQGDEAAFGALYELFAASVLGYVRGLGVADPEDALGEVFVSVVRDIGNFEGDGDGFRRWLFTIAHRRAMDAHRKSARRPEVPMDPHGLPDSPSAAEDLAEAAVHRVGLGGDARAALDLLTEDQRAVVLLRIVADLSVADTAAVLGKQPGAVKTLQRRALAALRRTLIPKAVSSPSLSTITEGDLRVR